MAFVVADAVNVFFLILVALCCLGLIAPPADRVPDDEGEEEGADVPAAFRYIEGIR
jgi:hypothetical protein